MHCTYNSLRKNNSIVVTKPYKGNGVVLLDRTGYVSKGRYIERR